MLTTARLIEKWRTLLVEGVAFFKVWMFLKNSFFNGGFNRINSRLTVAPGADVKVEDTWNFFIVISVRGGHGE